MKEIEKIRDRIMTQMDHIESVRCKKRINPCTVSGCPRIDRSIRDRINQVDSVDALREAVDMLVCRQTYFGHCFEPPPQERLDNTHTVWRFEEV